MADTAPGIPTPGDDAWEHIRREARLHAEREPLMHGFLTSAVLDHDRFEDALAHVLLRRLQCTDVDPHALSATFARAFADDPQIPARAKTDLAAFRQRDPACDRYSLPFLYYKGYHGLQLYRVGHWLWRNHARELALYMQSRVSETCDMDIHPACVIGGGILIDHATSIVIGETAVVGDNVSMLHEVTLGGTGKQVGDRHPRISNGVLIGAGAKLLGAVRVGRNAKIGAGSVVLDDVAENCTVAGIPARPVGRPVVGAPALEMDHSLDG